MWVRPRTFVGCGVGHGHLLGVGARECRQCVLVYVLVSLRDFAGATSFEAAPTMEREGMVSFSAWLRRKARGLYSDRPGRQWLMHQLEVCPLVCVGKNECVQGAVDQ